MWINLSEQMLGFSKKKKESLYKPSDGEKNRDSNLQAT